MAKSVFNAVAISASTSPERVKPDEIPTSVSPQARGPPVPRCVTYIRMAFGSAHAGAGVLVGVSVAVSVGVSVDVGVSVGVLVGVSVGVDVSDGVIVGVSVGGMGVSVGMGVSDGMTVAVAVAGIGVPVPQAERKYRPANRMMESQKSLRACMVSFLLGYEAKWRM